MTTPKDIKLYNKIKKKVYSKIPKHSAYRSGILVKEYKKKYEKKYGNGPPYLGKKTRKKGLSRWFDEKWVNQRREIGYKHKNDIYRPTYRITKKTPLTHGELTKKEIKRARKKKYLKGRVNRFRKGGFHQCKYEKDGISGCRTCCAKTKKYKKCIKLCMNTTRKIRGGGKKPIKKNDSYFFSDYPEFRPNLSPRDMFKLGSFGGTYWRPIKSMFYPNILKNKYKKYPKSWWSGIPTSHLTMRMEDYDKSINKYGVRVGTSLKFWECKGWIEKSAPYGWVQWYCDFFNGKRGNDDERQVKRWKALAGPRGRFMRFLVTQIIKKKGKWDDETTSPKIRQVLQHWGYKLTKKDYNIEIKRRKSKKN